MALHFVRPRQNWDFAMAYYAIDLILADVVVRAEKISPPYIAAQYRKNNNRINSRARHMGASQRRPFRQYIHHFAYYRGRIKGIRNLEFSASLRGGVGILGQWIPGARKLARIPEWR